MNFPSAIIFVNNDLTEQVKSVLNTQLFLDQIMDGYTFDGYVNSIPNYVNQVHAQQKRILVIRDFWDHTNRELADIAIFIKMGLASIEHNKFGPPGQTYQVANLNIYQLFPPQPGVATYQVPLP